MKNLISRLSITLALAFGLMTGALAPDPHAHQYGQLTMYKQIGWLE